MPSRRDGSFIYYLQLGYVMTIFFLSNSRFHLSAIQYWSQEQYLVTLWPNNCHEFWSCKIYCQKFFAESWIQYTDPLAAGHAILSSFFLCFVKEKRPKINLLCVNIILGQYFIKSIKLIFQSRRSHFEWKKEQKKEIHNCRKRNNYTIVETETLVLRKK